MNLSNHDGIIGRSFTFGLSPNQAKITILNDGTYTFSGSIDIGAGKFVSSAVAADPTDIPNLELITTLLDQLYQNANEYVDKKISEITGGTTGENVMLAPLNLNVADLADSLHLPFGDLDANKFIDRIAFEITEPFAHVDGSDYEVSVGTTTLPEAYYPYTRLSTMDLGITFINIGKTLPVTTNIVMHVRKYVEPVPPPDPFLQTFNNLHPSNVVSKMTSDASGKVITFTLSGTDLTGDISDVGTFPADKVSGNFMDFAFNLNLSAGRNYRVVEMNSALALFDGDANVSQDGETWQKETLFSPAIGEADYPFIIGASTGDADYSHVYLYDLDAENPTEAIATYHIKNELVFTEAPAVMSVNNALSTGLGFDVYYPSISEGPMEKSYSVLAETGNTMDIKLSGVVSSRNAELQSVYPGISGKCTYLDIFIPLAVANNYRVGVYSSLFESIYGPSSEVQHSNGVFFLMSECENLSNEEDTLKATLPIGMNPSSNPMVVLINVTTNESSVINVNASHLEIIEPAMPTVMPMSALVTLDAVEADSGKLKVRVLSF